MKKAPFIVFDGLDGSGKGTQLKLLCERAKAEGRDFINTREPGGTKFAEEIRQVFKHGSGMDTSSRTQMHTMWAARSDLLENVIVPTISRGVPVFADRGDSSTFAYQVCGKGSIARLEDLFWVSRDVTFANHTPDLYIIIDVPAEVAKRRSDEDAGREKDVFDKEKIQFFESVRQGFLLFSRKLKWVVVVVDGDRSPEDIHEEIYALVAARCAWR